jgi:hypothetical protein
MDDGPVQLTRSNAAAAITKADAMIHLFLLLAVDDIFIRFYEYLL